MRIYLPSTLPGLAAALAAGEVEDTPLLAFAVTPALREEYGEHDGDMEEMEYTAMNAAADASLLLLAADPLAPRRRVVLAAEVADAAVLPSGADVDPAAVTVTQSVPLSRIVSAHVDDEAAAGDIALAVDGAESGRAREHELMWYATQELRYLVD